MYPKIRFAIFFLFILFLFLKLASSPFSKEPQKSTPQKVVTKSKGGSAIFDQAKLEKYLTVESVLLGVQDDMSLYFKDLSASREIAMNSVKSWIPASTIKTYVMLEAFRQRRLGLINFNTLVTIKASNVVPTEVETDDFPRLREGTLASVKQLVEAMTIQSDNTAYNTLLDILDRRNINLSLKGTGITETVVGEKLNLDNDQFQTDLLVPGRQPNTTTAKDLATFFDLLYTHKVADADEMIAMLKRQKINTMIPALLPSTVSIAHKTGEWAPIYHDGGIVYKIDNPFILVVFTNSNDPTILARFARLAYYQNADSVGEKISMETGRKISNRNISKIVLLPTVNTKKVLAATTVSDEKFPSVTAADLGITSQDLRVGGEGARKVRRALVAPGSLLYGVKRFFENGQLLRAKSPQDKINMYLALSQNRISEAKTFYSVGKDRELSESLAESENNLRQAVALAKGIKEQDMEIPKIKYVNDLNYAVLADAAPRVPSRDKERFIDTVYNFYQKNKREVEPALKQSVISNPSQQQPVVGTIDKVEKNKAVIKFDDGGTQEVILASTTPMRDFQSKNLDEVNELRAGTKVAVVGQTTKDGTIAPLFILRNVPREIPEKREGIILQIDPEKNTLQIENKEGKRETVKVEDTTQIKAKDTNVSLEGIKAGSAVTVFGQGESDKGAAAEIHATTVTVTKNSSGASEKIQSTPQSSSKTSQTIGGGKKEEKKGEAPKQPQNNPPKEKDTKDEKK